VITRGTERSLIAATMEPQSARRSIAITAGKRGLLDGADYNDRAAAVLHMATAEFPPHTNTPGSAPSRLSRRNTQAVRFCPG
jgi:hypothetical protein